MLLDGQLLELLFGRRQVNCCRKLLFFGQHLKRHPASKLRFPHYESKVLRLRRKLGRGETRIRRQDG